MGKSAVVAKKADAAVKSVSAKGVVKPVETKAVAEKTAKPKPAAKVAKTVADQEKVTSPVKKPPAPSAEERQQWIAIAAYHRAEKRGFAPGYEAIDWRDAEAEIDALIGKA